MNRNDQVSMNVSRLKTFACLATILLGGPASGRCEADLTSFEVGTGDTLGGWQLTLQFEKPAYKAGEPIIAIVTLKNTGDELRALDASLNDASDVTFIVSRGREPAAIEPWGRASMVGKIPSVVGARRLAGLSDSP